MRISVLETDPGYNKFAICGVDKVLLDGQKVTNCVTADEERGLVVCYATNEKGKFVFKDDKLVQLKVYGKVEIIILPEYKQYFTKIRDE